MADISEMPMPISLIKRHVIGAYQQNVEVAVVVIVQEGAAVADGLKDVERPRARDDPAVVNAGGLGNVREMRTGNRDCLMRFRAGSVLATGQRQRRSGQE